MPHLPHSKVRRERTFRSIPVTYDKQGQGGTATFVASLSTVNACEEEVVVVEIPKGSRNKYEIDHETGQIWLDRHLFTAMTYPADYGFFPDTLAGDGDPLDALVLLDDPTFPGCHLRVRPVGVFWMQDEKGPDAKVLCVLSNDPRWDHINDLEDLRPHFRAEIHHFFEAYKELEPGKQTTIRGWENRESAIALIAEAKAAYVPQH